MTIESSGQPSDMPPRIFLLSHMRAFSSLIGHILGSHPDINGYYEMHISYRSDSDLHKQQVLFSQQEKFKPNSRFLFDKLLHNDYELDLTGLALQKQKILITVRSPELCIKSIVNLFQQKEQWDIYSEPVEATKYYIQRLQKLSEFCLQNPQQYYYFDAELIQSSTQEMLDSLTHWLQLTPPLSSRYQFFSKTGLAGAGDSSSMIKSGKIVKEPSDYSSIKIPGELLETAEKAYSKYRALMIKHSTGASTAVNICTSAKWALDHSSGRL